MKKPTVLTVILNYKTPEMTLKAASAAITSMADINGEIVIVDNDSQDGSYKLMLNEAKSRGWISNDRLRVFQSGHNGGFGAGNNIGMRAGLSDGARPDYVYLLNSDAFPRKTAIQKLVDELENNPTTGIAGSFIQGPDGIAHVTAFRFPSILSELEGAAKFGPLSRLLAKHVVPVAVPTETCRVDWVAGASFMIRTDTLDDIGLFDERFFLYFEETDLCLRAFRAGWATKYVCDSKVVHIGSVSTGMKEWGRIPSYWLDSHLRYFVKSHGAFYALGATIANSLGLLFYTTHRLARGKQIVGTPYFQRDLFAHALKKLTSVMFTDRTAEPSTQTLLKTTKKL